MPHSKEQFLRSAQKVNICFTKWNFLHRFPGIFGVKTAFLLVCRRRKAIKGGEGVLRCVHLLHIPVGVMAAGTPPPPGRRAPPPPLPGGCGFFALCRGGGYVRAQKKKRAEALFFCRFVRLDYFSVTTLKTTMSSVPLLASYSAYAETSTVSSL